jgi:type VI secretion system secreted protein VgrG
MGQFLETAGSGQRNIRVILFVIILATLPFYCLGFILWGAAPAAVVAPRETATATLPPNTRLPSSTPLPTSESLPFITATSISPLQPTPIQFFPPGGGVNPLPPTSFIPPTQVIIPTSTPAPTLTPVPSQTPIPQATSTTIPIFPTDTPAEGGDQQADQAQLPPATEDQLVPLDEQTPTQEGA